MANDTAEVIDLPIGTVPSLGSDAAPEDIERELQVTQANLAGKLGLLEERTLGSIRDTLGSVNDTATTVQSFINDPVGTVQAAAAAPLQSVQREIQNTVDNIVRQLNPRVFVRKNPVSSVSAAVMGGLVTGLMLFRGSRPQQTGTMQATAGHSTPGFLDSLMDQIGAEIGKVSRELIGTASQSIMEGARTVLKETTTNLTSTKTT